MHAEGLTATLAELRATADARMTIEENVVTLERDFDVWKLETTAELVGVENPLTGKPHSHTSAKDGIKELPAYREWTVKVDALRHELLKARLAYDLAVESLRTARVLAMVEAGVANV